MIIFAVLLAIVVLILLWVMATYNGLIVLRTRVEEAWADIEVQLKRRYDLIPNLVSTVKGYATHEKSTFENVTRARSEAMQATGMEAKAQAENVLSGALKSLFAVSEAYPELKANENFLQLQKDLTDTEDKIQYSRRFYNGNVRDLNIKIQTFPANLIAAPLGFKLRQMFEAEAAAKEAPKVQF